ncbi:PKD domain-containing protein [Gracilimonas mengyeensis]|uniref:PKD domain-containing protein n=1 Tax=Gracilimonas mengyeensis TaxID=1302730 RepID=A0A521C5I8_9BACT|nr:PKD domain-containing protein [Gracilimonas mengyeensis]SMO53940.1 PKD domain-containing protein [Gracilimonas mengyeensis]
MTHKRILPILLVLAAVLQTTLMAQSRPDTTFKIFQFPADQIPRIDGDVSDWDMVPASYEIGTDQLVDDNGNYTEPDSSTLAVKVKVGWVEGMNRLYFLYEAEDDFWHFNETGLKNDTYEIVVDADLSGGPLIDRFHPNTRIGKWDAYFSFHGVHAQNYHIFTPPVDKDWTLAWGPQSWIKDLPYANAAYDFNFEHGDSGKLTLEFWITPFDYAGAEGPGRAVKSKLYENKLIGLSWAVLDYDEGGGQDGFWNLSAEHTMYGQASELVMFRLMTMEPEFKAPVEAAWDFKVIDMDRRMVAFQDESEGEITSWNWDFGDGNTSTEQHPIHQYEEPGLYVVVLEVEGPEGKDRLSKVWDVAVR